MKKQIPNPRVCDRCGITHKQHPTGVWEEDGRWECAECYEDRTGRPALISARAKETHDRAIRRRS